MNEHRQKLFRNLYDAVNDMFNTWDNIEDIYVSDLMAIRKAQMKLWREFKEEWQKEGEE
jgi:hypothetical protein